jgi:hypothetical protein
MRIFAAHRRRSSQISVALALHRDLAIRRRGRHRPCWLVSIALSAIVLGVAARARAHAGPDPAPSPPRPLPDYDGRGNPDAHAGSWALWIPRVLLFPLYVVDEYLLRRPLGWLITKAERERWIDAATDALSFGPEHDFVLVPTALFDFGLLPSVGLHFTGDHVGVAGNSLLIALATGGPKYVAATALDRQTWDGGASSASVRVDLRREVDLLFFGIGPDVTTRTRARYGLQQIDGHASYKRRLIGESSLAIAAGARTVTYLDGDCCGDPSIDQRIAAGELAAPAAYRVPYAPVYERADLVLDSRAPRPAPGTGGYLHVHEQLDLDLRGARRWLRYGGAIGGALDLDGHQRTVRLQVAAELVDPLRGDVPFNELASLGSDLMPGFVTGWMLGRSTIATQASYTWPVSVWLDGELRLAAGNAFGAHLDGARLRELRLSGDVGVITIGSRDQGFEVLAGLGTETLEQGAHVTSVRLTFGSRGGF